MSTYLLSDSISYIIHLSIPRTIYMLFIYLSIYLPTSIYIWKYLFLFRESYSCWREFSLDWVWQKPMNNFRWGIFQIFGFITFYLVDSLYGMDSPKSIRRFKMLKCTPHPPFFWSDRMVVCIPLGGWRVDNIILWQI